MNFRRRQRDSQVKVKFSYVFCQSLTFVSNEFKCLLLNPDDFFYSFVCLLFIFTHLPLKYCCSSYSVISTFTEEESLPPSWQQVSIPPKFGSSHFPVLTIKPGQNISSPTVIIEGRSRYPQCKVRCLYFKSKVRCEISCPCQAPIFIAF